MRLGPLEIIIILVVVLIIFGATRIKQVGEKLGGSRSGGGSAPARQLSPIRYPRLQALGILVIIGGIILVGLSFGIIKAVVNIAIWGGAIIFVGAAIIIISRRR